MILVLFHFLLLLVLLLKVSGGLRHLQSLFLDIVQDLLGFVLDLLGLDRDFHHSRRSILYLAFDCIRGTCWLHLSTGKGKDKHKYDDNDDVDNDDDDGGDDDYYEDDDDDFWWWW